MCRGKRGFELSTAKPAVWKLVWLGGGGSLSFGAFSAEIPPPVGPSHHLALHQLGPGSCQPAHWLFKAHSAVTGLERNPWVQTTKQAGVAVTLPGIELHLAWLAAGRPLPEPRRSRLHPARWLRSQPGPAQLCAALASV